MKGIEYAMTQVKREVNAIINGKKNKEVSQQLRATTYNQNIRKTGSYTYPCHK